MVREFASPVNVSPLIRFTRWCMLLAGIGYGVYRHSALQRYEDERRRLAVLLRQSDFDRPPLEQTVPVEHTVAADDAVVDPSRDDNIDRSAANEHGAARDISPCAEMGPFDRQLPNMEHDH